jgi:hypothetical protein
VRPPSRTPATVQKCSAIADANGRVLFGRCRDDDGPAPVIEPKYIDCSAIGHVVSISDPAHDMRPETSTPEAPGHETPADLLQLRVAATATRFCVDIKTAEPLRIGSRIELSLEATRHVQNYFQPGIDYRYAHGLVLEDSSSAVPGQVGQSGSWTSLLVTSRELGTPETPETRVLAPPFTFSVQAEFTAGQRDDAQGPRASFVDTAPQPPTRAFYP